MYKVDDFVEHFGGTTKVAEMTGLSKGRISQWRKSNKVPRPWALYFLEKYPNELQKFREVLE